MSSGQSADPMGQSSLEALKLEFISEDTLFSPNESLHVEVHGQFLEQDAYIEVFSYSDSDKLSGSHIALQAIGSNSISVSIFWPTGQLVKLCEIDFATFSDGEFHLSMEFLNSYLGADVYLWNLLNHPNRPSIQSANILSEKTADCTSKDELYIDTLGFGRHWGIITSQIKLDKVERKPHYVD